MVKDFREQHQVRRLGSAFLPDPRYRHFDGEVVVVNDPVRASVQTAPGVDVVFERPAQAQRRVAVAVLLYDKKDIHKRARSFSLLTALRLPKCLSPVWISVSVEFFHNNMWPKHRREPLQDYIHTPLNRPQRISGWDYSVKVDHRHEVRLSLRFSTHVDPTQSSNIIFNTNASVEAVPVAATQYLRGSAPGLPRI